MASGGINGAGNGRYSTGAMIFHWVIAIAVIVNWRLVEAAEHVSDAEKGALMGNHKALGITILLLTIARLIWRLTHRPPPLPASYKTWEKMLAKTMHVIFYVLLIGLPLGGWLASSYFERGFEFFGLFDWPLLPVAANPEMGKTIICLHHDGGSILLILIALHVLGALKHTFFDREGGLARMWPWGRVSR